MNLLSHLTRGAWKLGVRITLALSATIYLPVIMVHPAGQPAPNPEGIVWVGDMETGDLSQWWEDTNNNPSQDSGTCTRPANGVSTEKAHSGSYSMKMTIDSSVQGSGCRQFRYPEAQSGNPYYYSAWYYFPQNYTINGHTNFLQFKSKTYDDLQHGPIWILRTDNRSNGKMYFWLDWDGGDSNLAGPQQGDPIQGKRYDQTAKDIPINQWTHVEVYLKQSADFGGRITIWQDGVQLFDINNIRTKYYNADNRFSVNNYGYQNSPNPVTVYIDDVIVSTTRVGGGVATATPTNPPPTGTTPPPTPGPTATPPPPTPTPPPQGGFNPFGTVTLTSDFNVNGNGTNIESVAFWEAGSPNNSLMFVSSKDSSMVEVWKYPFNGAASQQAPLTHSCLGSGTNGVYVDQDTDLLYVSVRNSKNICIFNLPGLSYKTKITTTGTMGNEPSLAMIKMASGQKRLFVSNGSVIQMYNAGTLKNIGQFQPGVGVEMMAGNARDQVLFASDENGGSGAYAYQPNGDPFTKNGSNNFGGGGIFNGSGGGTVVYTCPAGGGSDNGQGIIIVSDQRSNATYGNDYEVFDRQTWAYLGTIKLKLSNGSFVYNTEGMALTQPASSAYPSGLFVAVNNNTSVTGISWAKVLAATGISCGN